MKRFVLALRRRPVALVAVLVLALLYIAMVFAEFLAPYGANTVFREHPYHPPNVRLHSRELGLRLQIQRHVLVDEANWRYAPLRGDYVAVRLFAVGPETRLFGVIRIRRHLFGTDAPYPDQPGWERRGRTYPVFLFGADDLGRDLLSRILYGSRISLTIGLIASAISLVLAIVLGGLAGYFGGTVDWLIMRAAELVILIPGLYLLLFLRSVLSRELDSGQSFLLITMILSFVGWPGGARLIRGLVHSIKREDFVVNAQLEGIPPLVIVFTHIIPQMSSILIVSTTLAIPGYILGEAILSYLGLGIIDPSVSWGSLLSRDVTQVTILRAFPWFLYPGLFLLLATLGYNFVGDLLRDVFDPYYRDKRVLS